MARYIDADELYKATQKRIAEANEARMAVVDDEFLDLINDAFTEDVAPRAEVDKAYWEGVEYGNKDGAALVAREIFKEIRDLIHFTMEPYSTTLYAKIEFEKLEVLKKKYTETEPPKGD